MITGLVVLNRRQVPPGPVAKHFGVLPRSPGRELVGIGHARIRVAPRRIVEPDPGSVVGDAHKTHCSVG